MLIPRTWKRLAALVALVALAVLARLTVFAPETIAVRTVAVERGRVEETVTNSRAGTVKARRRAKLAPEVGGRVVALPHRRGSRVHEGDVLLRIDDSLQRAQLKVAEGDLLAARAQGDQACLPPRALTLSEGSLPLRMSWRSSRSRSERRRGRITATAFLAWS